MNFAELVSEVISITKRPDLADRTQGAVRAATQKLHQSDFFFKDLVEIPVQFSESAFIQNFLPTDVLPRFRKAKYIRYWIGDANGQPGPFLKQIQIENALDTYGYQRNNVFYLAGQMIQIRANPAVYRVLFGAYVHPVLLPAESYQSWIADEAPYAIIYEAARTVFRSISLQEQAAEYTRLAGEILAELKMSYVDDIALT